MFQIFDMRRKGLQAIWNKKGNMIFGSYYQKTKSGFEILSPTFCQTSLCHDHLYGVINLSRYPLQNGIKRNGIPQEYPKCAFENKI